MKMSQALFGLLGLLPLSIRAADMPRYLFYDDLPLDFQPDAWERNLEKDVRRWKAAMTEEGVRPFFSYWGDFLANPVGGRSQEASWMQLLVVGGEVSLEKWLEWRGGSVVVSFTDAAGSNLSLPVGNVFTISQAYVMNSFALYDLYFKQRLLDGGIEVRALFFRFVNS
jgi:carbohydrate-selective porin OprB